MPDAQLLTYRIHEVAPYINWTYFFHAWGFKPTATHTPEARQLQADARQLLDELEGELATSSIFRLCRANADEDNLLIDGTTVFPLLRQQKPNTQGAPHLCLSDFVRPLSSGKADTVGLFASTVNGLEALHAPGDPYRDLLTAHPRPAGRTLPRHPPRRGLPFPARPVRQLHPGQPAGHATHRHHPDRKRSHASAQLRFRIDVGPSCRPLLRCGPHWRRPTKGLRPPPGTSDRCDAEVPCGGAMNDTKSDYFCTGL